MKQNVNSTERLQNNHYAIEESYKRLSEAIGRSSEKNIYMELGNLLLWILSTEEWHWGKRKWNKKSKQQYQFENLRDADEKGVYLIGLRCAYNLMKHQMTFIQLHIEDTKPMFSFPIEGSFIMGIEQIIWQDADEYNVSKNQKKKYKELMVGNEIFIAINAAIEFLNKEKERHLR